MIQNKIFEIIREKLNLPENKELTLDTTFSQLDADSLDLLEVIVAIEMEFDIEIPDEDLGKMSDLGAAISYVEDMLE